MPNKQHEKPFTEYTTETHKTITSNSLPQTVTNVHPYMILIP